MRMKIAATKSQERNPAPLKGTRPPLRALHSARSVAPFSTVNTVLQRKPLCTCDGGCPRCKGKQPIQPKLKVGAPNDKYEQEANRIAEQVMRMPDPQSQEASQVSGKVHTPQIQRECTECKEEEELRRQPIEEKEEEETEEGEIQPKPLASTITPLVQRQAEEQIEEPEEEEEPLKTKQEPGQTPEVTPNVQTQINTMRGGGHPLPESTRNYFEPRFNNDFSHVRVHTNSKAAESAQAVNAQAYTVGRDVVFGAGQYSPETPKGKRLLAHELVHVVQQRNVNSSLQKLRFRGLTTSSYEREATEVGHRVASGHPASVSQEVTSFTLQRLIVKEPAGGCGICYGPMDAGNVAHELIEEEFENSFPTITHYEFPFSSPTDENGRLDLVLSTAGGLKIGEIKPANPEGYVRGSNDIMLYFKALRARYPKSKIRLLNITLPELVTTFPNPQVPHCPLQELFVNPPVGGVYGYYCEPRRSQLEGVPECRCKEKEKKKKKEEKKAQEEFKDRPRIPPFFVTEGKPGAGESTGRKEVEGKSEVKEKWRRAAFIVLTGTVAVAYLIISSNPLGATVLVLIGLAALLFGEKKARAKGGRGREGVELPDEVEQYLKNNPELAKIIREGISEGGEKLTEAQKEIQKRLQDFLSKNYKQFSPEELQFLRSLTKGGIEAGSLPKEFENVIDTLDETHEAITLRTTAVYDKLSNKKSPEVEDKFSKLYFDNVFLWRKSMEGKEIEVKHFGTTIEGKDVVGRCKIKIIKVIAGKVEFQQLSCTDMHEVGSKVPLIKGNIFKKTTYTFTPKVFLPNVPITWGE